MRRLIIGYVIMIATCILAFVLASILVSCQQSKIEIIRDPCDPNAIKGINIDQFRTIYSGEAANIIAEAEAKNRITKQGRIAELEKYNAKAYLGLIILLVFGLIFWGYSRSKWGWVIPGAALVGMFVIRSFIKYEWQIQLVAWGLAAALLIWKAIEYQKERNENSIKEKLKGPKEKKDET